MLKVHMQIEVPEDINLGEFENWVDERCELLAHEVAAYAEHSTAFEDQSGVLRDSIRALKSKFKDGGWIVMVDVPHAHLVEFGHVKVLWGKRTYQMVPPKPFLRPAMDRVIAHAIELFRSGGEL